MKLALLETGCLVIRNRTKSHSSQNDNMSTLHFHQCRLVMAKRVVGPASVIAVNDSERGNPHSVIAKRR